MKRFYNCLFMVSLALGFPFISGCNSTGQAVSGAGSSLSSVTDNTITQGIPTPSVCQTSASLTVQNNSSENATVQVYNMATGNTVVLNYNLPSAAEQTNSLSASNYIVVATGAISGQTLLSSLQTMNCGTSYSLSFTNPVSTPSSLVTVHFTNIQSVPVRVLFDTNDVGNGVAIAAGASIFTQLDRNTGHTLRVYNYEGTHQIYGVVLNLVVGVSDYYYTQDTATPTLEFHNNLNTGISPEPIIVFIDGVQVDFAGNPSIQSGAVGSYTLPYSASYNILVKGLNSGNILLDLQNSFYNGNTTSVINVNP